MGAIAVFGPLAIVAIVAIIARATTQNARLRASRQESSSPDVDARLEELERGLQSVQHELAETQERLDFAERLLSKGREERPIGR